MEKQINTGSTVIMRMTCAVVFCVFTFCYLYFYQADILAVSQHVLSGGKTTYEPMIGALLITLVLYLLQIVVFALTKLYKRSHGLTYFPSFLALSLLAIVGQDLSGKSDKMIWLGVSIVLLCLFTWLAWFMRQYQPYEPKLSSVGFFSRVMWQNLLILTVMMTVVGCFTSSGNVFHYRMRMGNLMLRNDYQGALKVGKKSVDTDSSLVMLRAYALARQGELGQHLFEYPLTGGSQSLIPNGRSARSIMYPEIQIHRFFSTKAADDYRLCAYLMDGDLANFARSVVKCYDVNASDFPKHYQEALILYTHKSQNPSLAYHNNVLDADYEDLRKMELEITDGTQRANTIHDVYGNTYWYYYLYNRGKH